jgi:hypothetical protein
MGSKRLSEAQAAEKLGVTKATLANWRWRKYGPPYLKIGRRIEYVDGDITAWEESQKTDPSEAVS